MVSSASGQHCEKNVYECFMCCAMCAGHRHTDAVYGSASRQSPAAICCETWSIGCKPILVLLYAMQCLRHCHCQREAAAADAVPSFAFLQNLLRRRQRECFPAKGKKVKEADLYSPFIEVPHTQGAQVRITQCYLQTTPYLPLPRKHSPDGASQTEVADI